MMAAERNTDTNLIINYLPQTLTDEEFRSMFLSIGAVKSCKIIRDRATGYSYGFGFVEYVSLEDAQRAIQTLNGLQLQNKTIKVALARQGENIKGANLYVRNLPREMSEESMKEYFMSYGEVIQCRILRDPVTGSSKGTGFVLFDQKSQADQAMAELNGSVPPGGTEAINIKYAEDNKGKARPPVVIINKWGGGPGYAHGPGPMRNQGGHGNYRHNPMSGGGAGYGANYGNGYGGGAMSAGGPGMEKAGHVLFVYNVGVDADERSLWQLFSPFGSVQKVNIIRDYQKNNQCKGFGFVTMTNFHEANNAIQGLNGYCYADKPLQVSFKTAKQ